MRVKEELFSKGVFTVGDGLGARFWENIWLSTAPLADQ
jgi:hypothetical protein